MKRTYQSKKQRKKPFIHRAAEPEEALIKLPATRESEKLAKSPKTARASDFARIESIIASDVSRQGSSGKLHHSASSSPATYSALPEQIALGTALGEKSEQIMAKYKDANFPMAKTKQELRQQAQKYLHVIPELLEGKVEMLVFYTLAVEQRKNSLAKIMDAAEREKVKWKNFVGGFYGFARQHCISELVFIRFRDLLFKSSNKTIRFWTPEGFSDYVLANEIILRMVMDDMKISMKEAERVLRQTADFGCFAEEPLKDEETELISEKLHLPHLSPLPHLPLLELPHHDLLALLKQPHH